MSDNNLPVPREFTVLGEQPQLAQFVQDQLPLGLIKMTSVTPDALSFVPIYECDVPTYEAVLGYYKEHNLIKEFA